jgi:hypothetical protein
MHDHVSVELSKAEIEVLLESLKYSRLKVAETQGKPSSVRQENLMRLDVVSEKLRRSREQAK